jgi:fructose-1-phosphate kinase PfkB-like protein
MHRRSKMLVAAPNLCLDITIALPRLVPCTVARATATDTSAGGKGVNVARASVALGATPTLAGFLPARDGHHFVELLQAENPAGISLRSVTVDGVLCVASILLEDCGRVSVINGRGPDIAGDADIVRQGMAVASASCETQTAGRVYPARAAALFEQIAIRSVPVTHR